MTNKISDFEIEFSQSEYSIFRTCEILDFLKEILRRKEARE